MMVILAVAVVGACCAAGAALTSRMRRWRRRRRFTAMLATVPIMASLKRPLLPNDPVTETEVVRPRRSRGASLVAPFAELFVSQGAAAAANAPAASARAAPVPLVDELVDSVRKHRLLPGGVATRVVVPAGARARLWCALLGVPHDAAGDAAGDATGDATGDAVGDVASDTAGDAEADGEGGEAAAPGEAAGHGGVARLVQLDVARMGGALPAFEPAARQRRLCRLLLAALSPALAYHQGLQEVAAVVLLVVEDSAPDDGEAVTLARAARVLRRLAQVFELDDAHLQQRLHRLQELLVFWDPQLAVRLADAGVGPELFAQRFLRTLFAGSLSLKDTISVWDVMMASDGRFPLLLCVAMLMQVRHSLLTAESNADILLTMSQLQGGSARVDMPYCARHVAQLWSQTPEAVGRHHSPLPAVGAAASAAQLSQARESARVLATARAAFIAPLVLGDVVKLGRGACVLDVRACDASAHRELAQAVLPALCLHCPALLLADAGSMDAAGAAESAGAVPRFATLAGARRTDDYSQAVHRAAPALADVTGLCLVVYAGDVRRDAAVLPKAVAVRDVLARAALFGTCVLLHAGGSLDGAADPETGAAARA